jgi:hypothetical protein
LQCIEERFSDFDAAARQVPARDIAVLDQKYAIVAVEHHGTDPKRHASRETPIEVEDLPQHRLDPLSQELQVHRQPNLEYPDIPFDPCVITASLSLHSED